MTRKFDPERWERLLSEERLHTAWTDARLAYSLDPHLDEGQRALPAET